MICTSLTLAGHILLIKYHFKYDVHLNSVLQTLKKRPELGHWQVAEQYSLFVKCFLCTN